MQVIPRGGTFTGAAILSFEVIRFDALPGTLKAACHTRE
jgi:hypothetical protein